MAKSVEDGDVAVIYRVDAHATKRDPGHFVAVAQITSSPWRDRWGQTFINWGVQILPPEAWISSADTKASGLWVNKVPLTQQILAPSPVHLDVDQWQWLCSRLPTGAVQWLEEHAKDV